MATRDRGTMNEWGQEQNVAETERWASFILGGMMTLAGIQLRSFGGALLAAAGGGLIHRAVTGHCYTYDALGVNTVTGEPPLPDERRATIVEEASIESFPASDAPAWTPTTSVGAPDNEQEP